MKRISLKDLGDVVQNKGLSVSGHCYKCNKISYRTQKEAKDEASLISKLGKGHSYVYACPKENGWHLTSKKPRNDIVPRVRKRSKSVQNKKLRRAKSVPKNDLY